MINKNNEEGKINIQTETIEKRQGCCFKMIAGTRQINPEEREGESSPAIIYYSKGDSKNLSTSTNKKKFMRIAEPQ